MLSETVRAEARVVVDGLRNDPVTVFWKKSRGCMQKGQSEVETERDIKRMQRRIRDLGRKGTQNNIEGTINVSQPCAGFFSSGN